MKSDSRHWLRLKLKLRNGHKRVLSLSKPNTNKNKATAKRRGIVEKSPGAGNLSHRFRALEIKTRLI